MEFYLYVLVRNFLALRRMNSELITKFDTAMKLLENGPAQFRTDRAKPIVQRTTHDAFGDGTGKAQERARNDAARALGALWKIGLR